VASAGGPGQGLRICTSRDEWEAKTSGAEAA